MITVSNITKQYGGFTAVNNVSFSVDRDHVLGFLGPNGAGKTTVMKILTGYHFPTSGTALIDGVSVMEDPVKVKKHIGYLPESVPVYGDLTVDEYLTFIADVRLIPKTIRKKAKQRAVEVCGLGNVVGKKIETLSKGYKQRVGLAQAILHDPAILILDEPTTGLDPNQIIEIRSLIKELGKSKTVILSTHILQEVEAVCSQVLIINEGKIAAYGTAAEIAASLKGTDTWELRLIPPRDMDEETVRMKTATVFLQTEMEGTESHREKKVNLSKINGSIIVDLTFSAQSAQSVYPIDGEAIFDWVVSSGFKIVGMNKKKISLEDIFVKLTKE
ncbi:MAG: ATP-binding cassette domain-containing protein [Treponema sp.]|jgi:ABC-2 type transport system ATP-binding protein|nr:ATP-binding cassette domain-containing protein [Treponema sp.]